MRRLDECNPREDANALTVTLNLSPTSSLASIPRPTTRA